MKRSYEARNRGDATLLEAIDQAQLQRVSEALAKMEGLVPQGATIFRKAIEDAKTELSNYLKGGIKQFFKNLAGDPVLKATSFANAVRAGFADLPKIMKLYLPGGSENEGQKSILELVPQNKQQQMLQVVTKAFAPSSKVDIAQFFKGNSIPYVQNLSAAVQELLQNVAPNGGFKLGQQAAATPPPPVQQAPAPQNQAGQTGGPTGQATPTPDASQGANAPQAAQQPAAGAAPTTASEPTQTATASAATTDTAPTKAAQAPATQKKLNPKTDVERINNIAYFLASQTGVDKDAAQKLLAKLAELNGLTDVPTPQKPSNKLAAAAPKG